MLHQSHLGACESVIPFPFPLISGFVARLGPCFFYLGSRGYIIDDKHQSFICIGMEYLLSAPGMLRLNHLEFIEPFLQYDKQRRFHNRGGKVGVFVPGRYIHATDAARDELNRAKVKV